MNSVLVLVCFITIYLKKSFIQEFSTLFLTLSIFLIINYTLLFLVIQWKFVTYLPLKLHLTINISVLIKYSYRQIILTFLIFSNDRKFGILFHILDHYEGKT